MGRLVHRSGERARAGRSREGHARRGLRSTRRGQLVLVALVTVVLASCTSVVASSTSTTHAKRSLATSTPSSSTSSTSTTTATTSSAAWTTYGGGFDRTAADLTDPPRATAPVRVWTSARLDGAVYGEPLVFRGKVLVATENDTVDALSASTGARLWSVHLATPASAGSLPCGDISPTVGIVSTMVIDPTTDVLFASAETQAATGVGHWLYAISTSTHRVLWGRDVDQPGWTAAAQLQRAGLALDDGHVLLGFGGNYGDCGSYHGWVVGVPESGSGPMSSYEVPTARQGAIWAPAGVTVDGTGDVFVATGNGSAVPGQPFDHGDAVIELSAGLRELQYFAPTNWAEDNLDDADLGSTAPMLLGGNRLFIVGKQQTAFLLDASDLGGIGGQRASLELCNSRGGNAFLAPDVYVVCPDSGQIIQVQVAGETLRRGWTWTSPTGGASSPTAAEGLVWSIDLASSVLYGIDPSSGTTRYAVPLDVGQLAHFAAPTVAGGTIFVAGSQAVEALR